MITADREVPSPASARSFRPRIYSVGDRKLRVGRSHPGGWFITLLKSSMMCPSLWLVVLICAFRLLQPLPVQGRFIPVFSALASPNATLGATGDRCNNLPDWIGDGVTSEDCKLAIAELLTDDVLPRRKQEYEFYSRGAPRLDFPLPTVITPRKHEYGTFHDRQDQSKGKR